MITSGRSGLLQVLGAVFGVAVIVGNTIGAGIFRAPGEVARQLPDPALFLAAWVAGGLFALLGAIQLAELATRLPKSGGQYVYARHALGEYAGFVVGWSDWLSTCGTTAAVCLLIGEFTQVLEPRLTPSVVAAVAASLFAALQWRGVRTGSTVQTTTTAIKALAFLLLIAAAFALRPSSASSATDAAAGAAASIGAFIVALQAVIYTYDGWAAVVYFGEEVRNPGRAIPRALFGGVLTVIAIYLLVNMAFLSVLPMSVLAGEEFAAGAVAAAIFGANGDVLLRVLTIVSMLSAINSNHLMASRVLFALSRDRLFPAVGATVNAGGTPTVALFISTLVALLFIIFGETFGRVIPVLAFFFIANYVVSFTSLIVLRRRDGSTARPTGSALHDPAGRTLETRPKGRALHDPEGGVLRPKGITLRDGPHVQRAGPVLGERPYRAWGYPITTALALAGSVAFLAGAVATDTTNSLYALGVLAASYPVYRLAR